jgi:hypothetical protein
VLDGFAKLYFIPLYTTLFENDFSDSPWGILCSYKADLLSLSATSGVPGRVVLALAVVLAPPG